MSETAARRRQRWNPERHVQRLAALGYTPPDWNCFLHAFVGSRFNFAQRDRRTDDTGSWRTRDHRLNDALLLEHLEYRHWIATRCDFDNALRRFRTRFFAVDIDLQGDKADQHRRYNLVCRVFGAPTFLFESSASGGIHAYFHLAAETYLWDLRHRVTGRGALIELLAAHGLREENGVAEVYPRGRYKVVGSDLTQRKTSPQAALRLPFGDGSRLLNPTTLERRHSDPRHDLPWVREQFQSGGVAFVDAAALVKRARDLRSAAPAASVATSAARTVKSRRTSASSDSTQVDLVYDDPTDLWANGLTRPGQRHTATMTLAIDLASRGVDQSDAARRIHSWLDQKNNGVSDTYRKDSAAAHKDIDGIVRRVFQRRRRRSGPKWGMPRSLSLYELEQIMRDVDGDDALVDPDTGELLDRYEVERFLFELLARAKEWVLARLGAVDLDDAAKVRAIWPDQDEPAFVVQSPVAMRRRLRGFGKDRHFAIWRALLNGHAMRKVQGSSARAKRAARYLVTLDFGAASGTADEFSNLASALTAILDHDEIARRYGPDAADRIRRDALAPIRTSVASTAIAEERIRLRLRAGIESARRKTA